jgi:hypothetical protein
MAIVPPSLLNKAEISAEIEQQNADNTMHEEMRERVRVWMERSTLQGKYFNPQDNFQMAKLVGLTPGMFTHWYYGDNNRETFEAVRTFFMGGGKAILLADDLPRKPQMQSNEGAGGTDQWLAADLPGDEGPVAAAPPPTPPPTPPRATQSSNPMEIEQTKSAGGGATAGRLSTVPATPGPKRKQDTRSPEKYASPTATRSPDQKKERETR